MDIYTIDTETYYDREYSLSKITTESYVRDPRFEVIGFGIKKNDGPTYWVTGDHSRVKAVLGRIDWTDAGILCHNTMFDGAILSWLFGVKPKVWFDTLCMARAIHGVEKSASLKALAETYGVGEKGTEVLNALGKRREDFTKEELTRYGEYCKNDVELTYTIFNQMLSKFKFPKQELKLIDTTLRMFIHPILDLDGDLLEMHLQKTKLMKEDLLAASGVSKEDLMSNPKLAAILQSYGAEVPMKVSPTTGKLTYAMAKNDEDFKALAEHEDFRVQAVVAARLGTKSTLEETRTQRFIDISKRGLLPVPVRYYAAHTGRWGGDDKINLQNLPSRGPNAKVLKRAIVAPEGMTIIESDSAQIEARVLAWLAEQEDLVEAFAQGKDVYKKMAAKIYGVPESEVTKEQRFVGKTTILGCFAGDTLVLTDRGYVPIVQVMVTDKVWDGDAWVTHRGVIPQGVKPTIRMAAVAATADHEILTERGWRAWSEVTTNPSLFRSAVSLATSKSSDGNQKSVQGGTQWSDALAAGRAWLTALTSRRVARHAVTTAPSSRLTESAGSNTETYCRMMPTVSDCLTVWPPAYHGAILQAVKPIRITEGVASMFMRRGVPTVQHFFNICSLLADGMKRRVTSTASTIVRGMSRVTCGLQPSPKMPGTSERSDHYRQNLMTYDIAFAGPKNRYTIATAAGPIIVHNCGYGMGGAKFQAALLTQGMEVTLEEAKRIITIYRDENNMITNLWRDAGYMLRALANGDVRNFGRPGVLGVDVDGPGIILPSGLLLRYDGLRGHQNADGVEYTYQTRKGPTRIYGGKVIENVCQAIARCIIGEQMLRIGKKYRAVLTVHDSIVCCVPDAEAAEAKAWVEESMRWVPKWATGLPVNCEAGVGKNYGDCA